jgi:hypothetical protein
MIIARMRHHQEYRREKKSESIPSGTPGITVVVGPGVPGVTSADGLAEPDPLVVVGSGAGLAGATVGCGPGELP